MKSHVTEYCVYFQVGYRRHRPSAQEYYLITSILSVLTFTVPSVQDHNLKLIHSDSYFLKCPEISCCDYVGSNYSKGKHI